MVYPQVCSKRRIVWRSAQSLPHLIPVLVTGIQPPKSLGEKLFAEVPESSHGADAPCLGSCDEHRNCLSEICFTGVEAWMIPGVATPGIMRSYARTGMGRKDRPHHGLRPHQLRIAC